MRKKYLSALLFGALLVTSAGTFTSCKDYDDEINNLQEQITANADAIKALQDKINSGKWVTELTSIENGFKVTFSDGQSFEIVNGKDGAAGADGKPGTEWTIGEDGYWYKDNVKTEYKAAIGEETGKVVVPTIKDGIWYIVNEETGELVATDYKANGASYAVAEANGGFTLYMPNEDGTEIETIYIPGPAGAITSIETAIVDIAEKTANALDINKFAFAHDGDGAKAFAKLTGKTIPAIDYILTSDESFELRVNPVNVDAAAIEFSMINSKNEVLPFVTLVASEYKDYVTVDESGTTSRAAYGNGLYTLNMKKVEVKDDAALETLTKLEQTSKKNIAYAVSADLACRGEYNVGVKVSDATATIGKYKINNTEITVDDGDETKTTVDTKATNTVTVETPSHMYDMWLSAAEEDVNLFELKFDQEKHTFSVNADPDVITKSYFDLTISTLDNNGNLAQVVERIQVSSKIVAETEYAKITHNIVAEDLQSGIEKKNFFTADMSTMTTSLGSQLDTWKKNVTKAEVAYYTDEECKNEVPSAAGVTLSFLASDNTETAYNKANNNIIKSAVDMKFSVDNDNHTGFDVDKTYYAKVTFSGSNGILNSVIIPFEFKIPALSTLFTVRSGYVVDDVINAYFYNTTGSAAVELERYFSKYVADANVEVTGKIDNTDCSELFVFAGATDSESNPIFANGTTYTTIALTGGKDSKGKPAGAYGEAVTVKVTKGSYLSWDYKAKGANEYSFKIRLMSPVYEGSIAVLTGERVIVNANDFVNGANITEKDIEGRDYNNNNLYIFPDAVGTKDAPLAWSNKQIKNVTPSVDNDHYIESATMTKATTDDKGNVTANGVINIKGRSLSNDTNIDLPVTIEDAWGYKLDVTVPVTVKVGK